MQSYNDKNRLVGSTPLDIHNQAELVKAIQAAEREGAVKHVIGKLPVKGQTLEINGLLFKVEFADYVKGQFQVKMKLKGPKK